MFMASWHEGLEEGMDASMDKPGKRHADFIKAVGECQN